MPDGNIEARKRHLLKRRRAYLVVDGALCEIKLFADAEKQLELISIVEVMEIMNTTETKGTWPRRYHQRDV
jgi:hypothetical protein